MKRKGKLLGLILMLAFLLALPISAQAATAKVTAKNITKPTSLKQGSSFSLKGTLTCSEGFKQVRVLIYNTATKKYVQRYYAKTSAKTYNLANADPHIVFDKLPVGSYAYRIICYDKSGDRKTVVNSKFSVVGKGTIKVSNPKPSSNISIKKGASYSLSGTIRSTYKLSKVTATISRTSNGKAVYSKTVKPNKTSYNLKNSALDSAMKFDKLAAGTYKLKVTATDRTGKSANVIYRTVTVKSSSSSNTNSSATGGNSGSTSGNYLDTNDKVTTPKGYAARVGRPSASNKYFYNGNYNIYYKYNSLAPTGKKYYGNQYVTGNCTWYACGRAMEIVARAGGNIAKVQAIFGGDPVGIYNTNANLKKFKYGKTPKIGALAVFNYGPGGDAHIAVVEKIINGVPYVSESGYTVSTTRPNSKKSNIVFKYQSIYNWAGGRSLRGYIYLI